MSALVIKPKYGFNQYVYFVHSDFRVVSLFIECIQLEKRSKVVYRGGVPVSVSENKINKYETELFSTIEEAKEYAIKAIQEA